MSCTDKVYNAETGTPPIFARARAHNAIRDVALRFPPGRSKPAPRVEGSPTLFYLFCILAQAPPEIARKRAQCRFGGSQGHAGSPIPSGASPRTQATIRLFP